MKTYQTHIVMVSGQMIPNVTPVLDEDIRPEKVILCTSDKMKEKAKILAGFFKGKKIDTEIFPLGSAYDFSKLQDRFLELAMRFEDTESIAINLTGGTKLMTIAAQLVFEKSPCFYVIPEKDQIILLNSNPGEAYEIEDKIQLRDYFELHGYTVKSQKRRNKIAPETVELAQNLLKQYDTYKAQLGTLNHLAAKAEDAFSLEIRNEISDDTCNLLDLFYQQGSITYYDDKKIQFASKSARDFCKGLWLEEYVANELHKVDEQLGLQDFSSSVEIVSSSGTKNEIDAAFLYNNELYVIECKTAKMGEKGSDVLYKLDTIRNYAGLYTQSIIASFKELRKYDRIRANDLKINLIEGRDLNRLSERIIQLIEPDKGDQ